jgi:hypothetical protein
LNVDFSGENVEEKVADFAEVSVAGLPSLLIASPMVQHSFLLLNIIQIFN